MRHLILCSLLFLIATPGLRADDTTPKPAAPAPVSVPSYRVSPEDVLDITVQDHTDLSKVAVVLPDGTISYPYVGEFKASGMTLREIQDRITSVLSKEILTPNVTVTIKTLHERPVSQVVVLGAVRTAGKFTLKEGWRVLDLLIECGGLPNNPNGSYIATLTRKGTQTTLELPRILSGTDIKANLLLEPNDMLRIQEVIFAPATVNILGQFTQTGFMQLPKDGSVLSILIAAKPTLQAALSKAEITHDGKMKIVDLSGYAESGKIDPNIKMEAGDTLFIPINKLTFGVYGSVGHQGEEIYPENEKIKASKALNMANGATQDADLKKAAIIHPMKDGKENITPINLEEVLKKGNVAKDLVLAPGDKLYIPPRGHKPGINMASIFSALSFANLLGLGL